MILVTHEMKFARNVASHHRGTGPPEQVFGDPKSEHLKRFISSVH